MGIKRKLNKEQFKDALAKGLGRAMSHILQYGLDEMADIVLEACIHNTDYDAQCEDGKAKWLYEMFKNSSHYNNFRNAILSSFKASKEWNDIVQLCDLTSEMAFDGDGLARTVFKEFINSKITECKYDFIGDVNYIKLEGEEGVLEIARIYGQRLINNPEDDVPGILIETEEERRRFNALLKEHSYSDDRIKVFFEHIDEDCGWGMDVTEQQREIERENKKNEFLSMYTPEKIIEIAEEDSKESSWLYRRFGFYADENDLEIIFARLLEEKNDNVRKRLLKVFSRTALPRVDETIFEWIKSNDKEFRCAIILALSNCKDARVHNFAYERIKSGKITGWPENLTFDLLIRNYQHGDSKIIMYALVNSKPDKVDIHSYVGSISDIADMNKTKELKDLLLWAYENTPCTNCREDIVVRLDAIGMLSSEILEECRFDSLERIRNFTNKKLNQ
ncbi:MAG: HEAT repeat domain-containing protein [Phycisphaerales bacterium]